MEEVSGGMNVGSGWMLLLMAARCCGGLLAVRWDVGAKAVMKGTMRARQKWMGRDFIVVNHFIVVHSSLLRS
jgi:hypothetical protein